MGPRGFRLRVLLLPLLTMLTVAEIPAEQAKEASHQERFADPEKQAEKIEREAASRLAADPHDLKALGDRGNARLKAGKLDGAIADLSQAAALDPNSADLRANLAFAYLLEGRTEEALNAAQEALAINPKHAGAHFYIGKILLQRRNRGAEAITHLEAALDAFPEDVDVNVTLFNAYRQVGDFVKAGYQLRILRMVLPPNHPTSRYLEGLLQGDLGNVDAAIGKFRSALADDPNLLHAKEDLGLALVQTSRWSEAVDVLGPLAKSQPQSFPAAYFYALALQNSGHSAEAEAEVRRALEIAPSSADAETLLGIILATRPDYHRAIEALSRAVQLDPRNFDAQFYLGRASYAINELGRARAAFEAASALRPQDREVRFFLATALENMGEKDSALALYRQLTQESPDDPRGFVGLGVMLSKYGQSDEALEALRHARQLDPQNYETNLAMGRLLVQAGKVQDGLSLLAAAVEKMPDSPEAHYQLGLALRRAGRTAEAEREFSTVRRLNQEHRKGGMENPSSTPRSE